MTRGQPSGGTTRLDAVQKLGKERHSAATLVEPHGLDVGRDNRYHEVLDPKLQQSRIDGIQEP